jgi:hypothetical protein
VATVSNELANGGLPVDVVVTIDPVSKDSTRTSPQAGTWIDVNAGATPSDGWRGDFRANRGGKWGAGLMENRPNTIRIPTHIMAGFHP